MNYIILVIAIKKVIYYCDTNPFDYKIIKESSPSNFGHTNLIWEGDVNFPKRSDQISNHLERPFDKQKEVKDRYTANKINVSNDEKKYFELFRYGINNLQKPNSADGPTLCMSLFMPNTILHKNEVPDYSGWTKKYFLNQIKLCVVFNHYFPNGNYRIYFDYYMLKKFESLSGTDDCLKITKYVTKISYSEYEVDEGLKVQNILNQFYNILKQYDDVPFKNGLVRFLFSYDLACRSYTKNGKISLRKKTGDFFVYKFKGPFIENAGNAHEGHITNAYIGQHVRYIVLRQSNYDYRGHRIKRPSHMVWRDAHMNCIAYNDHLWIKEMNKLHDKNIYFLPNSLGYT